MVTQTVEDQEVGRALAEDLIGDIGVTNRDPAPRPAAAARRPPMYKTIRTASRNVSARVSLRSVNLESFVEVM
jgi:hypothetical protein